MPKRTLTPAEVKQKALEACYKRLKEAGPRDHGDDAAQASLANMTGGIRLACLHIMSYIEEIKLEVEEK